VQGIGACPTRGVAELGSGLSQSHQQFLAQLVEPSARCVEGSLNLAAALGRGLAPEPYPPARGAVEQRTDADPLRGLTGPKLGPQAPSARGQHGRLYGPEQTPVPILLCRPAAGLECAAQSIQGIARTQVAEALVYLLQSDARSSAAPRGCIALVFT